MIAVSSLPQYQIKKFSKICIVSQLKKLFSRISILSGADIRAIGLSKNEFSIAFNLFRLMYELKIDISSIILSNTVIGVKSLTSNGK